MVHTLFLTDSQKFDFAKISQYTVLTPMLILGAGLWHPTRAYFLLEMQASTA